MGEGGSWYLPVLGPSFRTVSMTASSLQLHTMAFSRSSLLLPFHDGRNWDCDDPKAENPESKLFTVLSLVNEEFKEALPRLPRPLLGVPLDLLELWRPLLLLLAFQTILLWLLLLIILPVLLFELPLLWWPKTILRWLVLGMTGMDMEEYPLSDEVSKFLSWDESPPGMGEPKSFLFNHKLYYT